MKTRTGRVIYRIFSLSILFTIMFLIFLLSHQSADDSSQTSGFLTRLISLLLGANVPDGLIRATAHFIEYGALGFLMNNAFFSFKKKGYIALPALLSIIYGISDEIHQYFIPGRAFQLIDILLDSVGVIAGVLVFYLIAKIYERKNSQANP